MSIGDVYDQLSEFTGSCCHGKFRTRNEDSTMRSIMPAMLGHSERYIGCDEGHVNTRVLCSLSEDNFRHPTYVPRTVFPSSFLLGEAISARTS